MKNERIKGAIRVQPIRIVKIDVVKGQCDDPWQLLRDMGVECQRAANRFYKAFCQWHDSKGHGPIVGRWMDEYIAWAKADAKSRGPKPQCEVKPFPPECSRYIYAEMRKATPRLHTRCRTLTQNKLSGDLSGRKASTSAFKRWQRIVADLGECPTFSRSMPIPLGKDNTKDPVQDAEQPELWSMEVRVDAVPVDGKRCVSTVLRLALDTPGRKKVKIRKILERCVSGEWAMKGSNLVPDGNQWYVAFCYEEAKREAPSVDPSRVAVLVPARHRAWRLRIDGRTIGVFPRGELVGRVRRQIGEQRSTRNESSRYGTTSRKGHGQRRARPDMKNREDDFKKTFNHQVTTNIVRLLQERGVGTLCFRQPKQRKADSRYLVTDGAPTGRPGLWPWYQVQNFLQQKTERAGIELRTSGQKIAAKGNDRGFRHKSRPAAAGATR